MPSLQLASETNNPQGAGSGAATTLLSFRDANTALPAEYNPKKIFNGLFGTTTPKERVLNARAELRLTRVSSLALLGFGLLVGAGLLFGVPEITGIGAALGIVNLGVTVSECVRLGQVLHDALDIVAERAGLAPLRPSRPTPKPARVEAA